MAQTKIAERQYMNVVVADASIANIGAGNELLIYIPPNGLLQGMDVLTVTAFDGTTNTLTAGDGTTVFANAVDVKTTGSETVANAPKFYPNGGTLTISLAQTGTATVGRALVAVRFVVLGRGNELFKN